MTRNPFDFRKNVSVEISLRVISKIATILPILVGFISDPDGYLGSLANYRYNF
jgi:hypothetical protein